MLTPRSLLFAQAIAHLSLIPMFIYGSLNHWLITLVVYFFNGCIGMTVTYHRILSHKAWNPPKWFEYFGALCATIGMTGSAISWVAVHRKHHKFTDTEKDPHSPTFKGFIYCQWLSMFEKVELKYVIDLSRQKFYLWQHKNYFYINLAYAGILALLDPWAIIYAWLAPACILWNGGSSIVTLSHLFGRNTHNLDNKAGNNALLALLVWGEGWHNNHHHKPGNPYFFNKFWQVDIGGYCIFLFDKFFKMFSPQK